MPIAVVGSGAGGLPAAVALAEAGLPVVLIERGKRIIPDQYPTNQYDYELRPYLWQSSADEWQGPVKVQRAFGLGGSTLCFQGVACSPLDTVLQGWGLTLAPIKSSIAEVVEFLRIAGEVQPAHPLNPVSSHLLASAKALGWKARPAPVAILSEPHAGRPSCNHCGLCVFGCRPGDKSSADVTWLHRLKRRTNATVLTDTRVERLELDTSRTIGALEVTGKDGAYRLPVRAVVLAAGVLETPYLLRRSRQTHAPEGLGNRNVGRFLTSSLWQSLLVSVPVASGYGYAGVPLDLIVYQFEERGIRLYQGRNLAGVLGPISAARYYIRQSGGLGVRPWMRENYPRLAGLGGFAESSTAFDDGIAEVPERRFTKPVRDSDRSVLTDISGLLRGWAAAAGAQVLGEYGSRTHGVSGAMLRGTCRMGSDPETSASMPDGQLWGYDNIVVSDASVLGRGLISEPSLILQALGLNFGRALARRLEAA